jgi:UDP-GlcNAc:undecaprenyl-phosphate/decaprenyl-phosphate GlcNAc-1-phosphate transferase
MDGLAAGISVIAAVTIAFLTWGNGQPEVAIGALVLAAASGGFLVYNFNPAKTFMGDCGSLFLGFCLAGLALTVPSTGMGRGLAGLILVPAAVMAVPILDTTLVTVKRLLVGRSIAHGGRDHTSHRLVALGLSERGAVLTLFALAAVFGLIAVGVQRLEVGLSLSLAIYATVGAAAFGAFLSTVRVYDPGTEERGRLRAGGRSESDRVLLRTFLRRRRFLLGMGVDLLLVVAAFVAAFHLRYDGSLPEPALEALIRGLPIVVVVKLLAFHLCGLHRGLWWYAGTPEILRTILGSVLGSAGALAALWLLLRLEGVPGSVLVVDGVLTTAGLVAVRFGFRGMRGLFHGPSLDGVRPILIYGAGTRGALALRELRRDPKGRMTPVGFLDDDPEKHGRVLLGLPVLGSASEASRIASEMGVGEVLVAVSEEEGCDMERLTRSLGANGLGLYVISVSVRPLDGAP